jgi:hypothetical protein
MSAPAGDILPVGVQEVRVYALDEHGAPKATAASAVVYEGLQVVGVNTFEMNVPDARRISHLGDNRILAQDILPRQEPTSGSLECATNPHSVYAAMTSTKRAVIGEASVIGYATDKQGYEPTLGMLAYQFGKEVGSGLRVWRSYMVPSTQFIINPNSMTGDKSLFKFNLIPSAVNHHLWKAAFATGVEGFTEAEVIETLTFNIPHVVSWLGDNVVTKLLFHASRPAVATAKIHAVVSIATDGTVTDISGTVSKAVDGITPASKPAAGEMVVAFYEYAASA